MTFFSSRSGNRGIHRSGGNLKKDTNIFHQIKVLFFLFKHQDLQMFGFKLGK